MTTLADEDRTLFEIGRHILAQVVGTNIVIGMIVKARDLLRC
jgi:hypothetical protein